MYTLELCAGTKSFSTVAEQTGYTAISVDNDPTFECTHTVDIREWDYRAAYPKDKYPFHFIWASPPCTQYSNAKRSGQRDFKTADSIVSKCLEIIRYYNPPSWCMENPSSGYLKTRPIMQGMPYDIVDYCVYEPELGRRKKTALWHNITEFKPKRCLGPGKCRAMIGRKHRCTCTGQYWNKAWKSKRDRATDCARVPAALITALLTCAPTSAVTCPVLTRLPIKHPP